MYKDTIFDIELECGVNKDTEKVFKKLCADLEGKVLDLGCGQLGHYWAMAYAEDVEKICYFDLKERNVKNLCRRIETISPEKLEEKFSEELKFLTDNGFTSNSPNKIAKDIVTKSAGFEQFDFLKDRSNQKFDYILCIESIECVSDYKELQKALSNIKRLLAPEGGIRGVTLQYINKTSSVKQLIEDDMEGEMNPSKEDLVSALDEAGFQHINVETTKAENAENYSQMIFFSAKNQSNNKTRP